MRATVDGVAVEGTPEEIAELLRLRQTAKDWPLQEPGELQKKIEAATRELVQAVCGNCGRPWDAPTARRMQTERALAGESFDGKRLADFDEHVRRNHAGIACSPTATWVGTPGSG